MKNIPLLLQATLLCLGTQSAFAAGKFGIADLQKLATEKKWTALTLHITDIPKKERSAEWKKLLELAALEGLTDAQSEPDSLRRFRNSQVLVHQFPELRKIEKFKAEHESLAWPALEGCAKKPVDATECFIALSDFVKEYPKDKSVRMRAAKLAQSSGASPVLTLEILDPLFKNPKSPEAPCTDPVIQRAAIDGLSLPLDSHKKEVRLSQNIGFLSCWNEMKDLIVTRFDESNRFYLMNTCPDLRKKSALSPQQEQNCP